MTSNSARQLLFDAKTFWTGVEGQIVAGELAEIQNLPQPAAFLVRTVAKGSPAWDAGIQGGDGVARINGEDVVVRGRSSWRSGVPFGPGEGVIERIRARMERAKSGESLPVKILRAGKIIELTTRVP